MFTSRAAQVIYHALIVTAQMLVVYKFPDLVPVVTPGLAILAAGLGFGLQVEAKK